MIGGDIMGKKIYALISVLLIMALLFSGCINIVHENGSSERPSDSESENILDVSDSESEDVYLEFEYEYVKAILDGNTLTVTILSGVVTDEYLNLSGIKYDEPYPVSGLEGKYTDLFIGSMGNSVSPFIFLLTDRGTVECVPVSDILYYWVIGERDADPVFASIGELPNLDNVISFYEKTESYEYGGYVTVYAVTADGDEVDLSFPYYYALYPQEAPPTEEKAIEILKDNDRFTNIEYWLRQGMSIVVTGETEYICREHCLRVEVGTGSEESFAGEFVFAVGSSGAIYWYDETVDEWIPQNMMANIFSGSEDYMNLFAIICEPDGTELENIYFSGKMEEVVVSDPMLYSETPMLLIPLENSVNVKVEMIDFNFDGEIESETVIADLTLSRGDVCTIYAKMMYDTSPLIITATWQDGPTEYNAVWWAVGGGEYGETYISYVTGYYEDFAGEAMG